MRNRYVRKTSIISQYPLLLFFFFSLSTLTKVFCLILVNAYSYLGVLLYYLSLFILFKVFFIPFSFFLLKKYYSTNHSLCVLKLKQQFLISFIFFLVTYIGTYSNYMLPLSRVDGILEISRCISSLVAFIYLKKKYPDIRHKTMSVFRKIKGNA